MVYLPKHPQVPGCGTYVIDLLDAFADLHGAVEHAVDAGTPAGRFTTEST